MSDIKTALKELTRWQPRNDGVMEEQFYDGDFYYDGADVERLLGAHAGVVIESVAQVPAAEMRAQALGDAIEEVAKVGALWIDYSNRDTAAPILNEAIAAIRALAHKSTADKASEVRAAEVQAARYRFLRSQMAFDKPAGQPVTMALRTPIYAPDHDVHKDWYSERFDASVDATVDRAMAAAPSTADSAGTGAMGEGADRA